MKSITLHTKTENNRIEMIDFYNEATEDYEFWSKDFNMHFGYFVPFKTNPLKRDSMLNEMNYQILKKLKCSKTEKTNLVDLGCGMGGSMRYMLKKNKLISAFGVTLSEFQVNKGNALLKGLNGSILKQNYNHTLFKTETFDAAIAVESFCHSDHSKNAIKEAYRILKPNGILVIVDAFLKRSSKDLCSGGIYAYRKLCSHWSLEKLETIENMVRHLKAEGFDNVKVEDASYRVAPSVLHVPFAILCFAFKKLLKAKQLKRESLHNLKGSFYALLSGLHMKSFGYYLITCTK